MTGRGTPPRRAPATDPGTTTRLRCERTNGFNEKPGTHYYEWCPFCGHRTDEDHEIVLTVRD